MRYGFIIYLSILVLFTVCCKSTSSRIKDHGSKQVYVKSEKGEECRIYRRWEDGFKHVFGEFYVDREDRFYIQSALLDEDSNKNLAFFDVFVEIPRLDAATYRREGEYLLDKDKVICVFENSDGGNYVEVKGVDPASFKIFKNVFGGRDKEHVFLQDRMLEGVDPQRVKVYSEMKDCANCDGYLVDGRVFYHGVDRVEDTQMVIPKEFKYVE